MHLFVRNVKMKSVGMLPSVNTSKICNENHQNEWKKNNTQNKQTKTTAMNDAYFISKCILKTLCTQLHLVLFIRTLAFFFLHFLTFECWLAALNYYTNDWSTHHLKNIAEQFIFLSISGVTPSSALKHFSINKKRSYKYCDEWRIRQK